MLGLPRIAQGAHSSTGPRRLASHRADRCRGLLPAAISGDASATFGDDALALLGDPQGAIRTPWRGPAPLWRRGRPGHTVVKAKPYGRLAAGLDNGSLVRGREPRPNKRHRVIAR